MIRRSSNVAVLLLTVLGASSAAPAASTTYDQRQEGGANFNVDLENFIVLVARPSATSTSGLDLLGSLAGLNAMAALGSTYDASRAAAAPATESEARVSEAKERRDAEVGEQRQEEPVVKAQLEEKEQPEKAVAVQAPEGEKAGRSLEDIVRTLRNLKSKQPAAKEEARGSAGKYKFVDAVEEPQNLKLVGDGLENCGPGRSRDRLGICEGDAVSPE